MARRKIGLGPQKPTKGTNPARANGKGINALFKNTTQAQPPKRRPLGHGGLTYPQPETRAQRAERLKNQGVTPRRSQAERALEERGIIGPAGRPTNIDSFNKPSSKSEHSQEEIRRAVDRASAALSLETQEALRRADWYSDTSALLPVRPTNTSDPGRPRTLAAGFDARSGTLFVRFRGRELAPGVYAEGVGYEYYSVSQGEWDAFRNAESPGDYINKILNSKPYTPATW
ncbi:KTSC domain-containing protein [Kitasatospora sp. NPDC052896]|uniref:KTSC domain-containing protein n=1 Tax=Kitasatospora sp. NPDC052896 TaxID=3364061 RepID=UPI0037C9D700